MCGLKDSEKGTGISETAGQVESLPSTRQVRRVTEAISAAKVALRDEGKVLLTIPADPKTQQPVKRRYPRKLRTLSAFMRILIVITVILALFVGTSPFHIGRYSGERYLVEIILGISYIALGISIIATCASIVARNSLSPTRRSRKG
jgi:hypothetical protein